MGLNISKKGVLDLISNTAKGVARQINMNDGGQTFSKVTVPKPSYAPLPTIATNQPLPTMGADGVPTGIGNRGAVFKRGNWVVNQGPILYDPYGKNRNQEYADSEYLRISPYFKDYPDFQPKEQITSTEQLNRLLGRN